MYYIKTIYSLIFSTLLTVIFAIMAIIISFIPFLHRYIYLPAFWWANSLKIFGGVKTKVIGLESVDFSRPTIIVMNHRSHFDVVALMSSTSNPLHFVAKQELRKIPFMGYSMQRVGMIFLDRTDKTKAKESMRVATKQINDGSTVVMFPEGTRSNDNKLQEFKKGAFFMAKEARAYILPIVVLGAERTLPKYSLAINPSTITVRFGDAIKADENQSVQELLDLAKNEMKKLIALGESKL